MIRTISGCFIGCVMLVAAGPTNINWETEVIASDPRDSTIMYSLVAVGSFRGHWSEDITSVRDDWLKQHPGGALVPVVEYPASERVPSSRIMFVWMVQKKDNLVIALIRRGCLLADYVKVPPEATIKVGASVYSRFLEEAFAAERTAKAAKLGVWAERHEEKGDD